MYILLYAVSVILTMIWFHKINRAPFITKPFGVVFTAFASLTLGIFIGPMFLGYLIISKANKYWLKGL